MERCPVCEKLNDDNWPVSTPKGIENGGCQVCWEEQSDIAWWKAVIAAQDIMEAE